MSRFDRGKPQFGKQAPMPSQYNDADMDDPAPGGMPGMTPPAAPAQKAMPMPMKRKKMGGAKGKKSRIKSLACKL